GTRAELVGRGHRRHLALLEDRLLVGVVLLDRLLVALVVDEVVPVVDEPIVGGGGPCLATAAIVEDERLAVREEREVARAGGAVELDRALPGSGAEAPRLPAPPRGVETSVMLHGSCRRPRDVIDEHLRLAAVERHAHETASMRDR